MKDQRGRHGFNIIAFWLLIFAGLNWGTVGIFDWNVITAVFGSWPVLIAFIDVLFALSAIAVLVEVLYSHCICACGVKNKKRKRSYTK